MRGRDQRAHVGIGPRAVTDTQGFYAALQLVSQRIGRCSHSDSNRNRHAPLAGRAIACTHEGIGGLIQVRIGHDDKVILGAAESLHALAAQRAFGIDADMPDIGIIA